MGEQKIPYQFAYENLAKLIPDVYVITAFPRTHEDEVINPRFRILKKGSFQPDLFTDEVLLAIDTDEGLVVLLGCSHPGMKNMLDFTSNLINRPLFAVLGGTHLVEADENSLGKSMNYFSFKGAQALYKLATLADGTTLIICLLSGGRLGLDPLTCRWGHP